LIYFNFFSSAAKFGHERTAMHGQPDPVQHEPCGLLRNSDCAVNLVRRDSVFAVAKHPHRQYPLVETDGRVLKDRSDLGGELLAALAVLALPAFLCGEIVMLFAATLRAFRFAIRPTRKCDRINTGLLVAKMPNRLLESFDFA